MILFFLPYREHREARLAKKPGEPGDGSAGAQGGPETFDGMERRERQETSLEERSARVSRSLQELPDRDITALLHGLSATDVAVVPSHDKLEEFLRNRTPEERRILQEFFERHRQLLEQGTDNPFELFRDFLEGQSAEVKRMYLTAVFRAEPRGALPVLAALRRKIGEIEQLTGDRHLDDLRQFLSIYTDYDTLDAIAGEEPDLERRATDPNGTLRLLSPVEALLQKYSTKETLEAFLKSKNYLFPEGDELMRRKQALDARKEGRWASWTDSLRIPGTQKTFDSTADNLLRENLNLTPELLEDLKRTNPEKWKAIEAWKKSLQKSYDGELAQTLPGYIRSLRDCEQHLIAFLEARVAADAYALDQRVDLSLQAFLEKHQGELGAETVKSARGTDVAVIRIYDRHDELRDSLYTLQAHADVGKRRRITDVASAQQALRELSAIEAEVGAFERDPVAAVEGEETRDRSAREVAGEGMRNPNDPIFQLTASHGFDGTPVPEWLQEITSREELVDGKTANLLQRLRTVTSSPGAADLIKNAARLQASQKEKATRYRETPSELIDRKGRETQERGNKTLGEVQELLNAHPVLRAHLPLEETLITMHRPLLARLGACTEALQAAKNRAERRHYGPEETQNHINDVKRKEIEALANAEVTLGELQRFLRITQARVIEQSEQEFLNSGGKTHWKAFYESTQGTIYINRDHPDLRRHPELKEETIHHEQGHALIWAFEQTLGKGVVIQLHDHIERKLSPEQRAELEKSTEHGDCGTHTQKAGNAYQRKFDLVDECLNRLGNYEWLKTRGLDHLIPEKSRTLHDEMIPLRAQGELPTPPKARRIAQADTEEELNERALRRAAAEEQERIQREAGEVKLELHNLQERFSLIERWIDLLRTWARTYAHLPGAAEWFALIDNDEQAFQKLKKEWLELNSKGIVEADLHADFLKRFNDLYANMEKSVEKMQDFNQEQLDLRAAPTTGRAFWMRLTRDIEWMTVWDLWAMIKDFGEDITRRWKRRQEGVVGKVGQGITQWIPDAVPYLGVLKHESRRREQDAELAEVEQWKKSLKNMDKYEIRDFGLTAQTPDQLKAAIFELTEKGDMNWQDVRFWRKLSSFSHYTMPIGECRLNENLREQWLHKIIGDIWNDHDLYHNWKKTNDSAIESGKEKWRDECDRLSNIEQGLSGELQRMLMVARQHQKDPTNPALKAGMKTVTHTKYEKIIFYSIDNGKMSMEQKLFYLVQGIDAGIIMPDRLRSMAGETGKVLNRFPVLDYFYQSHNTLPELKALAQRLWEKPGDSLHPANFKPGMRTTLWLNIEVAREKKVQERLRKGIDKAANDMDHDDFHIFLPRLDASQIDQLANPVGGARQKITRDAWQNGYVGFNAYFKTMGYLAHMDEDKVPDQKFAAEDAADIARAVAAYLKMDGILMTRFVRSADLRVRPYLTKSELASNRPVLGEKVTQAYKTPLDAFVGKVLRAYQIDEERIEKLTGSRAEGDEEITRRNILCDNIAAILQNKIGEMGTGPLKALLRESAKGFENYGGGSIPDYDKVKEIFKNLPDEKRQFLAEASTA